MTQLSVNVNKIATLRNARGGQLPDLIQMTRDIIQFGAQGITVHPRPDERHIRKADVLELAKMLTVEFNIEGYPDPDFLALVQQASPQQCTLVPDPPHVITSNAGWDLVKNEALLKTVISTLQQNNIRVSLFVDPENCDEAQLGALNRLNPERVELYTEAYAAHYGTKEQDKTLAVYRHAAEKITTLGIALNAGHDLNCENLRDFVSAIPVIQEVSIGHALICDALYYGMKETIRRYLDCLQ